MITALPWHCRLRVRLPPRDRTGMRGLVLLLVLATSLGLGSGCRSPRSPAAAEAAGRALHEEPGVDADGAEQEVGPIHSIEAAALALLPVDAWAGSRILRQRVRVEWPSGGDSFDAVLQRRPGELALIGLGPMNLMGFRLALVAGGPASAAGPSSEGEGAPKLEFENRSGRALPFSPAHILADVQRVFYPWLPDPWLPEPGRRTPEDCPGGCERSGRHGAVAVWERRLVGHLAERRFVIAGRPDAGEVRIRYADWQGEPAVPRRVELENGWFGYRLTIETLEATALPDR